MKLLFALFVSQFFLFLSLHATQITNVSVYNRAQRIDIMLTFSSPYSPLLHQSKEGKKLIFSLDDASLKEPFSKHLDSKLVSNISIVSAGGESKIIIDSLQPLDIQAQKGEDKLSLRLRLLDPAFVDESLKDFTKGASKDLKGANEGFSYTNYALILGALFALVVLLWVLKFYFSSKLSDKNFRVVFARGLDRQNKFMVLEYKDTRYTMIIGSSNLLLESSSILEGKSAQFASYDDTPEGFARSFDASKQRLEELAKFMEERQE